MGPNALRYADRVLAILRAGGVPDELADRFADDDPTSASSCCSTSSSTDSPSEPTSDLQLGRVA
jgi:hypothetical protein